MGHFACRPDAPDRRFFVKIAVPSNGPGLDGSVACRLGGAAYLVVVESGDMSVEVLDGPPEGPSAGVEVMALAVEKGAKALLAGYVAPHIAAALEKRGIAVVEGASGTVGQAVAGYLSAGEDAGAPEEAPAAPGPANPWGDAAKKAVRQFYAMVPRLVGVVLLLGLLRGFVSRETLFSLFAGVPFLDALWGSVLGSVMVGNPVNSYVIGESLLKAGVSLSGALALMMAWVTVGLVQLPVEAESLGMRFAVVRNLAGFAMAVLLSLAVGVWP
jgi:predicted Fe-Mo cluster-binding NifX family protein